VNLRPLSDAYRLGNRFGLVFLKLPIHVDSPGTRLQVVKQHMDMIKRSLEAIVVLGMLGVIGASPHWVQRLVTWFLSRKTTAILTNVPGPRQSLYLAQAPIQSIMFWVPQTGTVGLGISILSYAGHVQIGLTADSELIPDLELLVDSFEHELTRLIHTT
jgi:hypothetical protein